VIIHKEFVVGHSEDSQVLEGSEEVFHPLYADAAYPVSRNVELLKLVEVDDMGENDGKLSLNPIQL